MADVLIRYSRHEPVAGSAVYVQDVADVVRGYPRRFAYAGVSDPAEATRFTVAEAERLVAVPPGALAWPGAELVPADELDG